MTEIVFKEKSKVEITDAADHEFLNWHKGVITRLKGDDGAMVKLTEGKLIGQELYFPFSELNLLD